MQSTITTSAISPTTTPFRTFPTSSVTSQQQPITAKALLKEFVKAIRNGNVSKVREMITQYSSATTPPSLHITQIVNDNKTNSWAPIHYVALLPPYKNHIEILEVLLQTPGLDINIKWTLLHLAVCYNNKQVVKRLLEHPNIDITVTDSKDKTAHDIAKENNHTDILELFTQYEIQHGAEIDHPVSSLEAEAVLRLRKENEDLLKEVQNLNTALEQLREKNKQYIDENINLKKRVNNLFEEKETKASELDKKLEENKLLKDRVNELSLKQENLEAEIEKWKNNSIFIDSGLVQVDLLKKCNDLVTKLQSVQSSLLNSDEMALSEKQDFIRTRNAFRGEIIETIDQLEKKFMENLEVKLGSLTREFMLKKIANFLHMKQGFLKDKKREMEIQSIEKTLEDLEEKKEQTLADLAINEAIIIKNKRNKSKLEELEKEAVEIQAKIDNIEKEIQATRQLMYQSVNSENPLYGFPELHVSIFQSKHLERVDNLEDFYEIEKEGNFFLVAIDKHSNQRVFVKRFEKLRDWKLFKTELENIDKLNHQCVIKINSSFYDDNFYYIEMPFIERGTLYDYLFKGSTDGLQHYEKEMNQRKPQEIQQVCRTIIQTVAYIHDNGIIHRDLKMENIMMQTDYLPLIIDFDMSKNKNRNTSTTLSSQNAVGTLGYFDPATLHEGKKMNTSSDVYAFGIILMKCFAKYPKSMEAFLHPGKEYVEVDSSKLIIQDQDLILLLKKCLQRDQDKRPTAIEIVYDKFFTKILSDERNKTTNSDRIGVLKRLIAELKGKYQASLTDIIDIKIGSNILDDTCVAINSLREVELYKRFQIKFEGEEGIDAGALSTSFYRRFFQELSNKKIFERGTSCYTICTDAFLDELYGNNKDKINGILLCVGKILCKCIYDQRSSAFQISSSLFRYLISSDSSTCCRWSDYELFNGDKANTLNDILLMTKVEELEIDFTNLCENGNTILVNDDNKEEFVDKTVQYEMIVSRKRNLAKIKEGFFHMRLLEEHLKILNAPDFHVLLTGEQMVDIQSLVDYCLAFLTIDNVDKSILEARVQWIKEIIQGMDQNHIKLLLLFVTGYSSTEAKDKLYVNPNTFSGFSREKINIRFNPHWLPNRLPESHVCFYLLDLPLYENKEQMKVKLYKAIENISDTFDKV